MTLEHDEKIFCVARACMTGFCCTNCFQRGWAHASESRGDTPGQDALQQVRANRTQRQNVSRLHQRQRRRQRGARPGHVALPTSDLQLPLQQSVCLRVCRVQRAASCASGAPAHAAIALLRNTPQPKGGEPPLQNLNPEFGRAFCKSPPRGGVEHAAAAAAAKVEHAIAVAVAAAARAAGGSLH